MQFYTLLLSMPTNVFSVDIFPCKTLLTTVALERFFIGWKRKAYEIVYDIDPVSVYVNRPGYTEYIELAQ